MEQVAIKAWGNSQGIRISKTMLDDLKWNNDEKVSMTVKDNSIINNNSLLNNSNNYNNNISACNIKKSLINLKTNSNNKTSLKYNILVLDLLGKSHK